MIGKNSIKAKYLALVVFSMLIFAACSLETPNALGDYKKETITVDSLEAQSKLLTKEQYSIDSVCSLELPQNLEYYSVRKLMVRNNRAYVQINSYENSVYVYDSNGKLLWKTGRNDVVKSVSDSDGKIRKVGKKADAKDEQTVDPADFFVDDDNNLHIFDRGAQKIFVFDSEGKVVKTIYTQRDNPCAVGLMNNGEYMLSFAENTCGAALANYDEFGSIKKQLLPFGKKYNLRSANRLFFQNGNRLCHIPLFSDSILVFYNDKLEKVVKVDFKGRFITDVIPDVITGEVKKDETFKISSFDGVQYISVYQETDSWINVCYALKKLGVERLIRKKTNETFSGNTLFEGLQPFTHLFLLDDKLVFLAQKDMVEYIRRQPRDEKFMEEYNKSAPQVQALIDGKIKAPAIFYISIK